MINYCCKISTFRNQCCKKQDKRKTSYDNLQSFQQFRKVMCTLPTEFYSFTVDRQKDTQTTAKKTSKNANTNHHGLPMKTMIFNTFLTLVCHIFQVIKTIVSRWGKQKNTLYVWYLFFVIRSSGTCKNIHKKCHQKRHKFIVFFDFPAPVMGEK